ncbi:MAG: pyrroline-5-carboxylate reductase [Oscillospiraceae bacterium]|nr:pyrroline-5-carboxylate reductase [Oscillospiraceae bacterium]
MRIGFVGMGNMARPIVATVARHRLIGKADLFVHDPSSEAAAYCQKMDYVYCQSNAQVVAESDIIFLLIKPQYLIGVLQSLTDCSAEKCFVSFAAGITTASIAVQLHPTASVMRVMPNTPMQIGCGACALAIPKDNVPMAYVDFLREILDASGMYVELPEAQMDAVIAVNGSTPALFYQLAQAIAQFGATHGIDEKDALLLAAKTMEGSARMLLQGDSSPDALTNVVTSKGGTTFEMLQTLRGNRFYDALNDGLTACVKRAEELAK